LEVWKAMHNASINNIEVTSICYINQYANTLLITVNTITDIKKYQNIDCLKNVPFLYFE